MRGDGNFFQVENSDHSLYGPFMIVTQAIFLVKADVSWRIDLNDGWGRGDKLF